jgi:hypothetical protein
MDAGSRAAEYAAQNPSGVETPEEIEAFMSRLKPRPTNILTFSTPSPEVCAFVKAISSQLHNQNVLRKYSELCSLCGI